MATIKINNVTALTESSGVITLDSGVTVSAAGVTGVLPVGVTGGSGLNTVPGASWVKLEETDASGASTVTMGSASIFSSTYDLYVIVVTKMKPSGANNTFRGRFYLDGTLIEGDKYRWNNIAYNGSTETYTAEQSGNLFDIHVNINTAIESSADNHMNAVMYLYHPASTDTLTFMDGTSVAFNNANVPTMSRFFVSNVTTGGVNVQACTGLRFFMSAGTFTAKLVVYGVKN